MLALRVHAARQQPPPKTPPPKKGQNDLSKPPGIGPLSQYVADNDEQNLYIMQQQDNAAAAPSSGTNAVYATLAKVSNIKRLRQRKKVLEIS